MARVPLIGEERSDLSACIGRVKQARGKLINLYRVLPNSPPLAERWLEFNNAVCFDDRAIVEITVLAGAYNMHTRVARALHIDSEANP